MSARLPPSCCVQAPQLQMMNCANFSLPALPSGNCLTLLFFSTNYRILPPENYPSWSCVVALRIGNGTKRNRADFVLDFVQSHGLARPWLQRNGWISPHVRGINC